MTTKNGYVRLPTADADERDPVIAQPKSIASKPPNLRPGLYASFGKNRRVTTVSDQEELEMVKIKPRRTKHKKPRSPSTKIRPMRVNIIEEPLLPGDSLQRVALRYGCPVSLKELMVEQSIKGFKGTCTVDSTCTCTYNVYRD